MARDPPPPPEPTLAQMMRLLMEDREAVRVERTATLATLQHLTQIVVNPNEGNDPGNNAEQGHSKLRDFENTNPPVFSKSEQRLDADDWIHTLENDLRVTHVGDNEKTDYVTHYLAGSARAWWETTRALLPQNEVVT